MTERLLSIRFFFLYNKWRFGVFLITFYLVLPYVVMTITKYISAPLPHALYVSLPKIGTVDFQIDVCSGQYIYMYWDNLQHSKMSDLFISSLNIATLSCFFCSGHCGPNLLSIQVENF